MALGDALLEGTTVRVETSLSPLLPVFNVDVGSQDGPGLLAKFLRPKVTVAKGDIQLYQVAPAGEPDDGPPWGMIALLGVLLLLAIAVFK